MGSSFKLLSDTPIAHSNFPLVQTNGPTIRGHAYIRNTVSDLHGSSPFVCHYFGVAPRIPARELAHTWHRYCIFRCTNRFSKSRLILSKTRVSLHACASPAPENVVPAEFFFCDSCCGLQEAEKRYVISSMPSPLRMTNDIVAG